MKNMAKYFISYARDDGEAYAKTLRAKLVAEFGEDSLWRDREGIHADDQAGWWKQITDALDQVEFMLLLATPKAMESKIVRKEWRYARSKGVTVCPILVPDKYPSFEKLPFGLSQKHFYDLNHQWDAFIKQLSGSGRTTKIPFSAPDMPDDFVQRHEIFDALHRYLLHLTSKEADAPKNPVAISTALQGAGGFGKTTMAIALCHDEDIQNAYLDGTLWIELGETPDLLFLMNKLYTDLSPKAGGFADINEAGRAVKDLLADKNVLLVIDDVWNPQHVKPFLEVNPRGAKLVTTRFIEVVTAADADTTRVNVDEMKPAEATQLLLTKIDTAPDDPLIPQFTKLAKRLGNWALMLKLGNGMLRKRLQKTGATPQHALDWVNDELDDEGVSGITSKLGAERFQSAGKCIEITFRALDEDERDDARMHYIQLGIFPEGANIPISALWRVWDCKERRAEKYADQLDDIALVKYNVASQTINLHDTIRQYALETLGDDAKKTHQRLITAYTDLHHLPDEYAWRNIGYHLQHADDLPRLRRLLLDYTWLEAKLTATDPNALLADCDLLITDPAIYLIHSAVMISSHIITDQKDQFALQLSGRLWIHKDKADIADMWRTAMNQKTPFTWAENLPNPPLEQAGGALKRILQVQTDMVTNIELSSDGKYIAISGYFINNLGNASLSRSFRKLNYFGHFVVIYDLKENLIAHHFDFIDVVTNISWASDSKRFLVGTAGGAYICDSETGQVIHELKQKLENEVIKPYNLSPYTPSRLAYYSPDNQYIASLTSDYESLFGRCIYLWSGNDGIFVKTFYSDIESQKFLHGLAWSPDSRLIAVISDNLIQIWDIETDTVVKSKTIDDGDIFDIKWSPNGTYIALTTLLGYVVIWDIKNDNIKQKFTHSPEEQLKELGGDIIRCEWSPNARFIATVSMALVYGVLKIWDVETGEIYHSFEHSMNTFGISWSSDGKAIAVTAMNRIYIWNFEEKLDYHKFAHLKEVISLAWSSDSKFLSTGSDDETAQLWDIQTGASLYTFADHPSGVNAVSFSPNNQYLATSSDGIIARIWTVKNGKLVRQLSDFYAEDIIWSLAWSPDNKMLAICNSSDVELWLMRRYELKHTFMGHNHMVTTVDWSPKGDFLVTGSADNTVRLWDIKQKTNHLTLNGHTDIVWCVRWSPDGKYVASASYDKNIYIWNIQSGDVYQVLQGHDGWIMGISWSPNSQQLVSGGFDKKINIWDIHTGKVIYSLQLDDPVSACSWSPDGKWLALGDRLGRMVWVRVRI